MFVFVVFRLIRVCECKKVKKRQNDKKKKNWLGVVDQYVLNAGYCSLKIEMGFLSIDFLLTTSRTKWTNGNGCQGLNEQFCYILDP